MHMLNFTHCQSRNHGRKFIVSSPRRTTRFRKTLLRHFPRRPDIRATKLRFSSPSAAGPLERIRVSAPPANSCRDSGRFYVDPPEEKRHSKMMQAQPPLQPGPCAACKTQRRKCTNDCIFAPYFPPDRLGMENFNAIHAVYGASNMCKLLKEIEPSERKAAVESLVYEAKCRVDDKTYGCVGIVAHLQAQLKKATQAVESLKRELAMATYNQQSQPLNDQQLALLQNQNFGNFMPPMNLNLQQTMCPRGDTSIAIWDPQQLQQQQQQNLVNMMPLHMQQMVHPGIVIHDSQQSQQPQNMMPQQHKLGDIMPLNLQQMMHPRGNHGIVIREPQVSEQQQYLENVPLHLQQMMHPRGNPGILIRDPQEISKGKQLAHVDTAEEQQQIMLEELHLQQAWQENIRINQMQVASEPTLTLHGDGDGDGECETQPSQQAISMQEHLQCQQLQLQQQDPSLAQQQQFWQRLATHSQQHTQRESADDLLQLCEQLESSQSQQLNRT